MGQRETGVGDRTTAGGKEHGNPASAWVASIFVSSRERAATVLEVFTFFQQSFPRTIWLTVAAFLIASVLEAFAILSAVPLVMLIDGELDDSHRLGSAIIGAYEFMGSEPSVLSLMVTIGLLIALRGVLQLVAMVRIGYAAAEIAAAMRLRLLRALFEARSLHLVGLPAGKLQTTVVAETQLAGEAALAVCRLLSNLIQVALYVAIAFWISWQVSVLAILLGLIALVLLSRFIGIVRRASRNLSNRTREFSKQFHEALTGIRSIKAVGQEELALAMMAEGNSDIEDALRRQVLGREFRANLQEPILIVALLAGGLFLLQNLDGLETVAVLVILLERTMRRILGIQSSYEAIALSERALESVRETTVAAVAARERLHDGPVPRLTEGITFEHVSFAYPGRPVLRGVSLTIPANALIVVTGASGAGKSTLADLVIGLVDPDAGRILIDGVDLSTVDLTRWRSTLGYVPQDGILLHDSVFANVTFGDPLVDRPTARAALEAAGAWPFVERLPDGIETDIGERGGRLSGGQRQRILLARALVRQPRLLILDEATNALDAATDSAIAETLSRLRAKMTIVAIAHTSALIENADTVYALADGKVQIHVSGAEDRSA
ncbi:MAG: ABC transporter ATP-binding protein [Pseudomonadota bacterium]